MHPCLFIRRLALFFGLIARWHCITGSGASECARRTNSIGCNCLAFGGPPIAIVSRVWRSCGDINSHARHRRVTRGKFYSNCTCSSICHLSYLSMCSSICHYFVISFSVSFASRILRPLFFYMSVRCSNKIFRPLLGEFLSVCHAVVPGQKVFVSSIVLFCANRHCVERCPTKRQLTKTLLLLFISKFDLVQSPRPMSSVGTWCCCWLRTALTGNCVHFFHGKRTAKDNIK